MGTLEEVLPARHRRPLPANRAALERGFQWAQGVRAAGAPAATT